MIIDNQVLDSIRRFDVGFFVIVFVVISPQAIH